LSSRARYLLRAIRPHGTKTPLSQTRRRPIFLIDIIATDGAQLKSRLFEQGVFPDEVIFKYCWPRYAPPLETGIRSLVKSENLGAQFERLIAMHRTAPSSFPMPVGTVRSPEGEFAGYILEYVRGETLQTLISMGYEEEARRQLELVIAVIARLHRKAMPHGDINVSNVIVADDGRTVLIDPVANPSSGTKLQDEICLGQIGRQIEAASLGRVRNR
jgi:serine/threonine protein kinase